MASPFVHTGGFGGSSGASWATLSPVYTSGNVWFVNSVTGTDAASPRGKDRSTPLATLNQAHTNAANNDVIVLMSGHSETVTAVVTLSKTGVVYLGEGTGSSAPTFTRNVDTNGIVFSGAGCWVENLRFATDGALALTTGDRVVISGNSVKMVNCYFALTAASVTTTAALVVSNGVTNLYIGGGTQFVNSGATLIGGLSASGATDVELDDVTFDGGTAGWGSGINAASFGAVARLRVRNVDLLNGSEFNLGTTATVGIAHIRNKGGSARFVWAA